MQRPSAARTGPTMPVDVTRRCVFRSPLDVSNRQRQRGRRATSIVRHQKAGYLGIGTRFPLAAPAWALLSRWVRAESTASRMPDGARQLRADEHGGFDAISCGLASRSPCGPYRPVVVGKYCGLLIPVETALLDLRLERPKHRDQSAIARRTVETPRSGTMRDTRSLRLH